MTSARATSPSPRGLRVSEVFVSLQGEGPFCCRRAVFLRLAGCNLRCPWCDTKYSLDPRGGRLVGFEELASRLAGEPGMLVVTGGEPLLQRGGLELLLELLWRRRPGMLVQVETNGTLPPPEPGSRLYEAFYVVSPKDVPVRVEGARTHPGWFRFIRGTGRGWLKLLVSSREDAVEAVEWALGNDVPRENVYLMPLTRKGMGLEELLEAHRRVAGWALELGVNFSPRMHLLLGLR
ncbi:MAG: 7-carboxy-7-deazaguanine synthase QueE [Crenarchaeota archaeon]|nr:7-carboxy-7-deazaguanine synthase QueE [Thermoproteota archaeon]